jgi:hypothetical protein
MMVSKINKECKIVTDPAVHARFEESVSYEYLQTTAFEYEILQGADGEIFVGVKNDTAYDSRGIRGDFLVHSRVAMIDVPRPFENMSKEAIAQHKAGINAETMPYPIRVMSASRWPKRFDGFVADCGIAGVENSVEVAERELVFA